MHRLIDDTILPLAAAIDGNILPDTDPDWALTLLQSKMAHCSAINGESSLIDGCPWLDRKFGAES